MASAPHHAFLEFFNHSMFPKQSMLSLIATDKQLSEREKPLLLHGLPSILRQKLPVQGFQAINPNSNGLTLCHTMMTSDTPEEKDDLKTLWEKDKRLGTSICCSSTSIFKHFKERFHSLCNNQFLVC